MRDPILALPLLLVTVVVASAAAAAPRTSRDWLHHLIPLPKEIAIGQTVTVPAAAVAVRLLGDADGPAATAAAKLREALGQQSDAIPAQPAFEIMLGRCSMLGRLGPERVPGAERLRKLRNSDQAYAIAPVNARALALAGLTDKGVYYAALTLCQLLEAGKQGDQVTIPLVTVVDWPDLSERGEWGGSANRDIEWMAAQKMNLVETHVSLTMSEAGRGVAQLDEATAERGRLNALHVVPIITHLDQLGGTGIYEHYPELMGKGEGAKMMDGEVVAPCFSQPKTAEVLSDWMVDLAEQPGVDTVCIWLSEIGAKCACADCQKEGQFVLETRACVKAWRLALERNPQVKLRILLTQGSFDTNDKVLAEVPEGVEVSYYDGGRTYNSSRDPMIYPLLVDYLKKGRWLGCYPQLTASWRIVCPWSGPQFIRYRMIEFVDKGLANLCGYATPDNRLYDFNVTAAAEWSWNAHGRDEREFATAWATRRGLKDPAKAAEWAVSLGPVGWDVYGSGVPFPHFFGNVATLIRNRQAPVLGQGVFRYFPTTQHFAQDLAICERAAKLAEELQAPALIAETQVIGGYVTMLTKLHAMATLLSRPKPPTEAVRQQLNADLFAFSEAGYRVSEGLQDWARVTEGQGGSRLTDTIQTAEQTVADVSTALEPLGLRNNALSYFRQKVGVWESADFEAKEQVTKTWEVTPRVGGPGEYQVQFSYTTGWWGLSINRVALASAPAGDPTALTEVAEDEHKGTAATEDKENVYRLDLKAYDPARKYFLVADIQGVRSSDKPENRRGCNGEVIFWRERVPGETLQPAPLGPMDPSEQARYSGPQFATNGVHLVVVMGGYGSEAMLAALKGKPDIEVQPLWSITAENLAACQVVILPQPRNRESLRPEMVARLAEFVRGGGGLIATHDAVGFRGLPAPLPEVCAGGAEKVRDLGWVVTAEHPVTAGLARGVPLPKSYYDYITLKPGPQGTVLATSPAKAPVLICGQAGKGRYVACGLAIGLGNQGDQEAAPTAEEVALLLNAVQWAGGKT